MKRDVEPWSDRTGVKITNYPSYLKGGFFIQQPGSSISTGTEISIVVTGNVTIYVAIQEQINSSSGGYEVSLPKNGWKKEMGKIVLFPHWNKYGYLDGIYSKDYRAHTKMTISLPPITTAETTAIITVVPICSGIIKS